MKSVSANRMKKIYIFMKSVQKVVSGLPFSDCISLAGQSYNPETLLLSHARRRYLAALFSSSSRILRFPFFKAIIRGFSYKPSMSTLAPNFNRIFTILYLHMIFLKQDKRFFAASVRKGCLNLCPPAQHRYSEQRCRHLLP